MSANNHVAGSLGMPRIRLFLAPLILVCLALACGTGREPDRLPAPPPVETLEISVTGSLPHDTGSFTQGLFFLDGLLFESTGNYGSSMLLVLDHSTGELLRSVRLDPSLFGEGCCLHGDTIYQLTWKEHVVLLYDPESLERIGELEYETEGWGICSDGESLIMSDGTSYLYFRDPRTFALAERVQVTCGGRPLEYINEMEYVEGEIYANVWRSDCIYRIDPASGEVTGTADASALRDSIRDARAGVLNGIAWVPGTRSFILTGKNWPLLFEVRMLPASEGGTAGDD